MPKVNSIQVPGPGSAMAIAAGITAYAIAVENNVVFKIFLLILALVFAVLVIFIERMHLSNRLREQILEAERLYTPKGKHNRQEINNLKK